MKTKLILLSLIFINIKANSFIDSKTLQIYNPIIVKKKDYYKEDQIFKDSLIIYANKINFIKYGYSIFTPILEDSKFPKIENKELKLILENSNYNEMYFNSFLTKLKSRMNDELFLDFFPKNLKKENIYFLFKDIKGEDYLVLSFTRINWEYFSNFYGFIKDNIYYTNNFQKNFLNNYYFQEFQSDVIFNKNITDVDIKQIDIQIIFKVTDFKIQLIENFIKKHLFQLHSSDFLILIKNIFRYFFLLNDKNLSSSNFYYITKDNKIFFPFLNKLEKNNNLINIIHMRRLIKNLVLKKLSFEFDLQMIKFLDPLFLEIYNIYKNAKIELENIFGFTHFMDFLRQLFIKDSDDYANLWNIYFIDDVLTKNGDFFFDKENSDEENSLMNVIPNDFFDTQVENNRFILKILYVSILFMFF